MPDTDVRERDIKVLRTPLSIDQHCVRFSYPRSEGTVPTKSFDTGTPTVHDRSPFSRCRKAAAIKHSEISPNTGCIGAHTFRAPVTPTVMITNLLHTGQPTANRDSALLPIPMREGAVEPDCVRTYVASINPLNIAVAIHTG